MASKDEIAKIMVQSNVPSMERDQLTRDLQSWEKNLLKPKTPEEIEIFLEKGGEVAYLFSENVLMVVEQTKNTFRNHIKFYPLKTIKSLELKMNGFELQGEMVPDSKIELTFTIRDKIFSFCYEKLYAHRLIKLLTNKILPNIRD